MKDIDKAIEESRRPPAWTAGGKMPDIDKVIDEAKSCLLLFVSWEKLPGESGAAYTAFCAYRDYGPCWNIRKALEKHEADPVKQGKRYRMWLLWSMQFKWVKRAEDYDLYIDRLKQTELRKTIEARGSAPGSNREDVTGGEQETGYDEPGGFIARDSYRMGRDGD
jgi:hypothetical protein